MINIELDINEIKHIVAQYIEEKYNLTTLDSKFTYDLIEFDEHLFGMNCEVLDKKEYYEIKAELDAEKESK